MQFELKLYKLERTGNMWLHKNMMVIDYDKNYEYANNDLKIKKNRCRFKMVMKIHNTKLLYLILDKK